MDERRYTRFCIDCSKNDVLAALVQFKRIEKNKQMTARHIIMRVSHGVVYINIKTPTRKESTAGGTRTFTSEPSPALRGFFVFNLDFKNTKRCSHTDTHTYYYYNTCILNSVDGSRCGMHSRIILAKFLACSFGLINVGTGSLSLYIYI